jgi:hypothetical protein
VTQPPTDDGSRGRPQVRGRYMRTFIDAVERLDPFPREAVLHRVGKHDLDAIASCGAVAWLDASINLRCTDAVCETLGEEQARAFFRGLLTLVYDTSLFAGFIRGVVRLFGRDLHSYCRWVQRGFGLAFRDVGHWTVGDTAPGRALMQLRGLPKAFVQDPFWRDTVVGSLWSLLDLAEADGTVTIVARLEDGADYELRWRAKR